MTTGQRQDRWLINMTVDGQPTGGPWDKMTGGDVSASDVKYRPGGMVPEMSLGGPTTIANMTVTRLYDLVRDHAMAKTHAAKRVGKARVVVTQQPLDENGAPWGDPIVRGGTLSKVNFPDSDSTGNAASMLEYDVSVDGTIG